MDGKGNEYMYLPPLFKGGKSSSTISKFDSVGIPWNS